MADPLTAAEQAPVGAVLPKAEALALRDEIPDDGAYAYQLADGTWIRTDTRQPLSAWPQAVQDDVQQKADALPKPTAPTSNNQAITDAFKNGGNTRSRISYSTGRNTVYIVEGYNGSVDGVGQFPAARCWLVLGISFNGTNGFSSQARAEAVARSAVSAQSDPASYDIVVQQ